MRSFSRLSAGLSAGAALVVLTAAPVHPQKQPEVLALATGTAGSLTGLRQADLLLNQLQDEGSLQLVERVDDPLIATHTHERFQQYHGGVPVFAAQITRQRANGLTTSLFGTVYLDLKVDTTPTLTTDEAARIVETLAGLPPGTARHPRLVVLPDRQNVDTYRLVYEAHAFTGTSLVAYFIDALSGDLVWSFDNLKTQQPNLPCEHCTIGDGIGVAADAKKLSVMPVGGEFLALDQMRPANIYTFDMRGDTDRTLSMLAGIVPIFDTDLAIDDDNQWTDAATVDAHVGMGWTYDYLYNRFGRESLDGRNVRLMALVHPIDRADLFTAPAELVNLFHLNAFYCGHCGPDRVGIVVFGEGTPPNTAVDGQQFKYFSGALDVVAHELAHGLTDFTSGLLLVGDSGALNEAFSDIIAIGTEFYSEPFYQGTAGTADYLIGEDITSAGGMRSLANPQQFGHPDHYSLKIQGTLDNGGVHANSLIASHAFYLAIEGGTNRVSGLQVQGVGSRNRKIIEKVFYRAFTMLLTRDADFSTARAATIQSALDLYGAGSQAEQAVIQAWTAVGVN